MDTLDLLMYLDEGLIKNLSSLVLSGYINIRTTKLIQDSTVTGRLSTDSRLNTYGEDREGFDEREGYKGSNVSRANHCEQGNIQGGFIEDREFLRREEEIQRIYTTFTLHSELQTSLESNNMMNTVDNTAIADDTVKAGDFVKINGTLTSESVNSYIDALLNMFQCYGCDSLDNIVKNYNIKDLSVTSANNNFIGSSLNFNALNNMLSHLDEILSQNSTQDMIMYCGDTPVILNVNKNFFMNNSSHMYDKIDCPCSVFGKVVSVTRQGDTLSLLRKTGQPDYYEHILEQCCGGHCNILKNSGIIVPNKPKFKCNGTTIVVLPISMSI